MKKTRGKIKVTLKAKIALGPKLRTTKPAPGHKIFPYLLRNAAIERPKNIFDTPGRFSATCQADERHETDALQSRYLYSMHEARLDTRASGESRLRFRQAGLCQ